MLALAALDRQTYLSNLEAAGHFIAGLQQTSGEIVEYQGATGNEDGSLESHGEALEAYADTIAGVDRWVATTGSDTTDCSIQTAPCATIGYAVLQAGPGNTIHVAAGTYAENVMVNESLQIVGAGQGATTVVPAFYNPDCSVGGGSDSICSDGTVLASVVFMVQANNVAISDLTVDGINPALPGHATDIAARDGIMTDFRSGIGYTGFDVHDTTVRNIYLRGLYAPTSGGYSTFHDNTVANVQSDPASVAIFIRTGGGIVDGNMVSGANDAISANYSTGTTFSNNTITDSFSGIHTDNNNDIDSNHDEIFGNNVNCGQTDAYGIYDFVPFQDVSIHDNTVAACAIGIGSFGGRTDGGTVRTTTFANNTVDGAGARASSGGTAGGWFSTTTFYYGDYDNQVVLTGNTVTGFDEGIVTERTGGMAMTTTANFNRIFGNGTGWGDQGTGGGTSDFVDNWWGCNGGPTTAGDGCDSATGIGDSDPWLVLSASATPSTINPGDPSAIGFDLTHDSGGAVAGTAFPDDTVVALSATRGNLPTSATTNAGAGQANLTGLTSGWSTVHVHLDNADVKLIVGVTQAAAFATVDDDTTGINPDADATCPAPDFNTITDAITTVPAGTKVLVCSGSYPENVVVDKSLTLKGAFAGTAGYDVSRDGTNEALISPATGRAVSIINTSDVVFDGFTIQNVNDTAISSGANYGGPSDTVTVANNRVLDVHAGAGLYTNGPAGTVSNWAVSGNLVRNVESSVGSGINLWKVDGGTISDNHVEDSAFGGIQINTANNVEISGNTISNTAHNGINVAASSTVHVFGNTITDANTSATATEAGLTLYGGTTDVDMFCNSVAGAGSNGFSTSTGITDPYSGIRVFDNAITVADSISHNLPEPLVIGSNWYGGGSATVGGSNAPGVQVADPLVATPIGTAVCNAPDPATANAATQVVAFAGTPQSAPVNGPFADPLVARVEDALGGAVMGESVSFTAPGTGASAVLDSPSGTTDFNGTVGTTAAANNIGGSYAVDAASGTLAPATFTLTNELLAGDITWDQLSWVYEGATHAPVAHLTQEPTATCTVKPSTVGPNAGSYPVHADCTGETYAASGDATATISAAAATVTLSNLVQTYDGSPKPVTVTTVPAGVAVAVTYDGNPTPPTEVGSYAVVATVTDPNYTGSASGTLQIVPANAPDLAVTITDGRDFQQFGKLLTYTIQVNNVGNTDVTAAIVDSVLPATLLHADPSWTCIPAGTATCTAAGSGDLHDTVDIPAGGGVVYLFNAWVNDDPNLTTDVITTAASVTANGDGNPANDSASDTTQAVIFRNGFDPGGDGSQSIDAAGSFESLGTLDDQDVQAIGLAPASLPGGGVVVLASLRGSDGDALSVEAIRIDGQSLVRIEGMGRGEHRLTGWAAVPAGASAVAIGLARDSDGHVLLLLSGADGGLEVPLADTTTTLAFWGPGGHHH